MRDSRQHEPFSPCPPLLYKVGFCLLGAELNLEGAACWARGRARRQPSGAASSRPCPTPPCPGSGGDEHGNSLERALQVPCGPHADAGLNRATAAADHPPRGGQLFSAAVGDGFVHPSSLSSGFCSRRARRPHPPPRVPQSARGAHVASGLPSWARGRRKAPASRDGDGRRVSWSCGGGAMSRRRGGGVGGVRAGDRPDRQGGSECVGRWPWRRGAPAGSCPRAAGRLGRWEEGLELPSGQVTMGPWSAPSWGTFPGSLTHF